MKKPGNYHDFYQKVNLFFDKELSKTEELSFLMEKDKNPKFQEAFNREKSFREFLHGKLQQHKTPNSIIKNIKENIRNHFPK